MNNCDAFSKKCGANGTKKVSQGTNLWLRDGVFYFIIELPRVNGKRRYKRLSLKTDNYYVAREKAKEMMKMYNPNYYLDQFERLLNGLIFVDGHGSTNNMYAANRFGASKRLSKKNHPDDISELMFAHGMIVAMKDTNARACALLNRFETILPAIELFLNNASQQPVYLAKPTTQRTISEVLESWIFNGQNCEKEQVRKRNSITKVLTYVNLTPNDDYSKFHDIKTIGLIFKSIIARTDIQNDFKRKYIRYVKNLAECGHNFDPDNYKLNVIAKLPRIAATKKADRKPHMPYSYDQLINMFNPTHSFFRDESDMFFTCLVAMFTGVRSNGAATLQYNDIRDVDGIPCIEFTDNHAIKALKTDSSERIVPIHPQLLKLGFVDYVRRKQKVSGASGTDFIFPRCITTGDVYYEKYYRILFNFLEKLGIRKPGGDRHDFHSFRNNLSNMMQEANIPQSYINDVIGWKGTNVMEQHYSKHKLHEIRAQMDKYAYNFLEPHFDTWKTIMAKK